MAQQVQTRIEIGQKAGGDDSSLKGVESVAIFQSIDWHHSFEIQCRLLDNESKSDSFLDKSRKLVGQPITITVSSLLNKSNHSFVFKGIVTEVALSRQGGAGTLIISGGSATLLLDGNLNSKIYNDKKISEIANELCKSCPDLKLNDNKPDKHKIGFITQFKESDYHFMKRIFQKYGHWFYFDGSAMQFGLGKTETVKLTIGHHLTVFNLSSRVKPMGQVYLERNYKEGSVTKQSNPQGPSGGSANPLNSEVVKQSKSLFDKSKTIPSFSYFVGEKHSAETDWSHVTNAHSEMMSATTTLAMGSSDNPQLSVGVEIQVFGKDEAKTEFDYGKYIITKITHHCSGTDRYSNQFEAIPASQVASPPSPRVSVPHCDVMPAIVTQNDDPEKLGRVRVKFFWDSTGLSPWIRCSVPYAGNNRGHYMVPEVDEEVLVGFELGNPDYPYVIGSLYNGKHKFDAHYDVDNRFKVMRTKSGNEILFDDKDGEERIVITNTATEEKNRIELSFKDQGKIALHTKGDMEFIADKNISISAGENLAITVGKKMEVDVKTALTVKSDSADHSTIKEVKISAGQNLTMKANQNAVMEGSAKAEVKSSGQAKVGGSITEVSASGPMTVKGAIVKIN